MNFNSDRVNENSKLKTIKCNGKFPINLVGLQIIRNTVFHTVISAHLFDIPAR